MKKSDAFTLLELIVVIFIISIVGAMVFSSMRKEEIKIETVDATTLPLTTKKTFKGAGEVELFCINKCKECYSIVNGQIAPYEGAVKFGKDVEIYKLDRDNSFVKLEELGRIKDKKICLRYHLYSNGSTTKMVIADSTGIYYLPSFFGEPIKVEEMEDAKELWLNTKYDLHDSGSFY